MVTKMTVVPSLRRRGVCLEFLVATRVPSAERRDYDSAVRLRDHVVFLSDECPQRGRINDFEKGDGPAFP